MSDSFRLVRLVGDGDSASGGGLPLPDAFTAVVQQLLDNGPSDTDTLVEAVQRALKYKEKRVFATWTTWDDFSRDILAQLADAQIIEPLFDQWYLALKFRLGERLIVIPETDIGITVYPEVERRRRNAIARARLDTRRVMAQLLQDGVDDPAIHAAYDAAINILGGGSRPAGKPKRPLGMIPDFTEKYLREVHPRKIVSQEIADEFNKEYPDPERGLVKSGVIVQKLNKMRGDGTAERLEEVNELGRKQVLWRYRY